MWFSKSSLEFENKPIFQEGFKSVPSFNETTPAIYHGLVNHPSSYMDIDYYIQRTPEALAIIWALVSDIISDGYTFYPISDIDGKQKENIAKKNIKRAFDFCDKSNFDEERKKFVWDLFSYGDSYLWMNILSSTEELKVKQETLDRISKEYDFSTDIEIKHFEFKQENDEDAISQVKHVPSTTMNIDHNNKEITGYRQIVGTNELTWTPDKIIHAKLITLQGKIYGWSPILSTLSEMSMLGNIKDYAGNFFKNGGVPDWMFILPKEMANSPNHKQLMQELQKYKSIANKHGNLVFTGEVEPNKLNDFNKDMEFRQLAIYLTGVLALSFNMPMSRVASIIGSEVKISTGADDLANEGYWAKISEMQDYLDKLFSSQLFKPYFNVRIESNKSYKINEIKESQNWLFKIDAITKTNDELSEYKLRLTDRKVKKVLHIDDDDVEVHTEPRLNKSKNPSPQMDNLSLEKGGGTQTMRAEKQKQVTQTQDISGN